jgi:hypothetical protein
LGRVADLDAQCTAGSGDAEVLIAEATDEVKRLLGWLLVRQSQRIGLDLRFDGRAHVSRRAKEAVGWHRSVDALVRTLKVVVLDEERDAPKRVGEVGKHRLAQKLFPQRLPEALDLSERLRVLRPTLAVVDAVAPQQLLELGLAAPSSVLPTLIGQHLARMAVLGDAALQRLDDEARLVVMSHRPRHQVSRVVVHEADNVDTLMSPQLEGEDVRLPELIRFRAFEPPNRLVTRRDHLAFDQQPFLVKDAAHRGLGDAEPLEPSEHIADSPCAPLRVRLSQCDHLVAGHLEVLPPFLRDHARRLHAEGLHSATLEHRDELRDRRD